MRKTRLNAALMVIGLVLAFGAFAEAAPARNAFRITVVVHGGLNDPFWQLQKRGLDAIQAQIPDIEVSYRGPADYNLEEFLRILDDAVQEQPDALICTMSYPPLMDAILRPAIAGGLPVIAINAADMRPEDERIPVLTYIGEDSYQIGVTAAEETLKRFTPKRAVFANHHAGAENLDARGRGWIDTMTRHGVPAEQIDMTSDDLGKSIDMVMAHLASRRDTDALFISNVMRSRSLIARLELDGYAVGDDLKIAQMDVEPALLEYLDQGKILFALDQQPYLQSYLGVMFAYLHVKYGLTPPPAPISTGPRLVAKEHPGETAPPPNKTYRLAVVVHGSKADPFWKPVKRGVSDAARLYPDADVTYIDTDVFDIAEFLGNLQAALASRPDAIVCTLTSPAEMDAILAPAIAAGLPVIAINAPDLRQPVEARIPAQTYIGEDSYFVGALAAQETLARMTPRRAVFFNHLQGAANIDARGRGWVETMTARGVKAESVAVSSNAAAAADAIAAYLVVNQDVDVMFVSNVGVTEAAIERLTADGVPVGESIKVAQMDLSSAVLEYILDDMILFTLDQQPYMQGYLGVVFAYLSAKYGVVPPPAPVSTGPAVVTVHDINPAKAY
jgi:simple sugar transport system substrate-binding protein